MIGRKIFVLVVTLLIYLSTFGILNNNNKFEASGGQGGEDGYTPIINYDWVYNKTENLSETIRRYDQGRDFGTLGERIYAKNMIVNWTKDIGIYTGEPTPISEEWPNLLI